MHDDASATEDNVPIPKHGTGRTHIYEDRYKQLQPGQSFTVPWSRENMVRSWLASYHTLNPEGRRYKTAREGDRLRIWRVDGTKDE